MWPFVVGIIFVVLGIGLIILGAREKKQKCLKVFLLIAGISAAGFLPLVVLHNIFYAFGAGLSLVSIPAMQDMQGLEVVFFLLAVIGCPIGLIVGILGIIICLTLKIKKYGKNEN